MDPSTWFLSTSERGNPATRLYAAMPTGRPWSEGNLVRPLIHGATYFRELAQRVQALGAGDLLMFVDWRGDPDEQLTGHPGSEVARLFADAALRGVDVRGLVWRSHWDRLAFSSEENRSLEEDINAAGGQCILDMRVRIGGSHHQKFVILRHKGHPDKDVVYLGGIDLCHSRRDDARHEGDPQRQPMARVYGSRPPWHDIQLAVSGPAVADVETVFRERWEDDQAPSRSPFRWTADLLRGDRVAKRPLPPPAAPPAPAGPHPAQLLRTYPRRFGGYPFAPRGERTVARGYAKAISRARHLIYIEDQYLWSPQFASVFAEALRREPGLHLVAVLPHRPDQDGRVSLPPNLVGRENVEAELTRAAPGRVAFYGIENDEGTPIYVHAKVCVIDDTWASVGSDNFNRRSWTHDSELSLAVCHPAYARDLRAALAREHLGLGDEDEAPSTQALFEAFASAAADLEGWAQGGRRGERPPGQLRPLARMPLSRSTRAWATPLYRLIYDPDGRPLELRLRGRM